MLTDRGSNIFEITDEPLRDDDLLDTVGSNGEDAEDADASSTASARTHSRLVALVCLIAGAGALLAVVPRDSEPSENDVETRASAPPSQQDRAHPLAARSPRIPREELQPGAERLRSHRTAAPVLRKRFASSPSSTAPSGADTTVVPQTPDPTPSDVSRPALPAPYEEFGFER